MKCSSKEHLENYIELKPVDILFRQTTFYNLFFLLVTTKRKIITEILI